MRRKTDILSTVAGVGLGLMALVGGCQSAGTQADSPPEPVRIDVNEPPAAADRPLDEKTVVPADTQTDIDLVLEFARGASEVYRVTTETEASVRWEGDDSNKPAAFRGGAIGNHTEITFEQRVESIDDNGNATIGVTIGALKYLGRSRETVVVDFDSSRDAESPLSKLIGRGYRMEMTPRGAVLAIRDVAGLRDLVKGDSPDHQTALKLISDKEIRDRHEVPPLMALKDEKVHPGSTWSNVTMLSFGRMGAKAYERLYTLQQIETEHGDRVADVTMKGIPSAAAAKQLYQSQTDTVPTGMFDNIDSYEGQLRFDLDAGRIESYVEQFRTEWVAVDQEAVQSGTERPATVRMTRTQLHRLERLD
jgi:hypothetical protein